MDSEFKYSQKKPLIIEKHRDEILNTILRNNICIIKGNTGCGKTTRVPLYLFNYFKSKSKPCNIVVTQPRRIAAISIAQRVSKDIGQSVGGIVGFQVGQEKIVGSRTNLVFCTTGVLLNQLVNKKTVEHLDVIILDEIHERDKDMDFLIVVIKMLLNTNPNIHVVMMSATVNTNKISQYFHNSSSTTQLPVFCGIYTISDGCMYDIDTFYTDTLPSRIVDKSTLEKLPRPNSFKPEIGPSHYDFASRLIRNLDILDDSERGSVLVFLPGIHEITEMSLSLENEEQNNLSENQSDLKWKIMILHSSIPKEQQDLVFTKPPPDVRKIILSTNIGESSITLPDIKYVVDFCLTKIFMISDRSNNFSSLKLHWASKSSLEQRMGRVGRVSNGQVFRVIPRYFYDELGQEDIPEMLRCPLDSLVLSAKMLDMGSPLEIFEQTIDPPDFSNIKRTILALKQIGALHPLTDGKYKLDDGDISFMGQVISSLPVDPAVGKLIFLGHVFNILEPCIIMGAAMSVRSPFAAPFKQDLEAYCTKLIWADSSCSDLIAYYNVYKAWQNLRSQNAFNRKIMERDWARKNFIQIISLREIETLANDIRSRLQFFDIVVEHNVSANQSSVFNLLLKIVIAGAFYPNYFSQKTPLDQKYVYKTLCCHNSSNTVYFKGFPENQVNYVSLYAADIKNKMSSVCSSANGMKISAESSKVFVNFRYPNGEFRSESGLCETVPGKVHMSVFRSVKMRMIHDRFRLYVYNEIEAQHRTEQMTPKRNVNNQQLQQARKAFLELQNRPGRKDKANSLNIYITHVDSISKFWAQDSNRLEDLRNIMALINESPDNLLPLNDNPRVNQVYAAPYDDGHSELYYRAKVLEIKARINKAKVKFIDYGNEQIIPISEIKDFAPHIAHVKHYIPVAFQCCLANVSPSFNEKSSSFWTKEANHWFKETFFSKLHPFKANIYSIVHGVVRLILFISTSAGSAQTYLIFKKYARRSDEPYESHLDHDNRERQLSQTTIYDGVLSDDDYYDENEDMKDKGQRTVPVSLRGPFSPLECSLRTCLNSGKERTVVVDRDSVNCVLLNTNPSDQFERALVAGNISSSANSGDLTARVTTLMPNIRGLPALLCLLFSPQIELRTNEDRTKIIGAMCGLGYDNNKRSLYPENDVEIPLDFRLVNDYLLLVNEFRANLNHHFCDHAVSKHKCEQILIELLNNYSFDLFNTNEDYEESRLYETYKWCQISSKYLINPYTCDVNDEPVRHPGDLLNDQNIYRLIWGVELKVDEGEVDAQKRIAIERSLEEMQIIADEIRTWREPVTCKLCSQNIEDPQLLRLHLTSQGHKKLLNRFHNVEETNKWN